jgi:hypothetical protein
MASANVIGNRLYAAPASGASWAHAIPSGWQILDLGEIGFPLTPALASANLRSNFLRIWARAGTTNVGIPTANLALHGVSLFPAEGFGRVDKTAWPRNTPENAFNEVGIESEGRSIYGRAGNASGVIGWPSAGFYMDRLANFRGVFPLLPPEKSGEALMLHMLVGARAPNNINQASFGTSPHAAESAPLLVPSYARIQYSLEYRPRFQFMKGL